MTAGHDQTAERDPLAFLAGGGEMGTLIRRFDWSHTPLGPIESWPGSLRTTVSICLNSDLPICIIWGPGLVQIYNDGYRVICGNKHPRSLGQSFPECWREAWPVIGEAHDSALAGNTAFLETQRIFLDRHGYTEECFFTFSFSPIRDDAGQVGGLFHPVIEMTAKMQGERRTRALRDVASHTANAITVEHACTLATRALAGHDRDVPFALLYLLDEEGQPPRLAASSGMPDDGVASVAGGAGDSPVWPSWPLVEVARTGQTQVIDDVQERIALPACGPYPEAPRVAVALALKPPGSERTVGVLVIGVSARLKLTPAYRDFHELLAAAVTTAVANGRAFEEERRKAEALAELDRTKTAFFANVSHEFRTPLTLMLGPVEDMLARSHTDLSPAAKDQLEVVSRNGLRLLRLVNTLLDFSRIEAGRVRAAFQPTDLASFTAELASVFRSACERAGLELIVDCPPLGEPVFVDRDMWEKVVLNLLSNAFKFTFEGQIAVSLARAEHAVELRVEDSGTGVPPNEMPRLFERFHRIENARGRTHEGSGIGLSLVQELVTLHGGAIAAESVLGRGTSFTVSVPLGSAHLPPDQIGAGRRSASTGAGAMPYVEEALRWLPDTDQPRSEASNYREALPVPCLGDTRPDDTRPRVLVADDNADMRQYVVRLLAGHFRTEAVADGEAALAAARQNLPDLILTDVMMPRLDGFGLLRALRGDALTSGVPVIMLSARAGEESRVEGMEAGADDYLVKPFSARELLARVTAHVQMAQLRRDGSEALRQSRDRLRMALTAARMVAWQFEPVTGTLLLSENADDVLGLPAGTTLAHGDEGVGIIHPDDIDAHRATVMNAIAECGSYSSQYRIIRQDDGVAQWMEERGHAVCDSPDQMVRLVGVAIDVSDRKRAEQERESLLGQLRERDTRKDEFLATLAHELRNPLAPICNGLQIIRLAGSTGRIEQARVMMDRQLTQMTRLVDDLLDVSRITRGKLELRKARVEMRAVIDAAVESARPLIDQAGHDFTVALPDAPTFVDGDVTRLSQVVSNLLTNAAKYTHPGGHIHLTVERTDAWVFVSVRDDGIGIPVAMLGRVFEMFTQVDRTLEKTTGGLGIGLSLAQGLVAMHGGKIEARSEGEGQGSEFVVRLPVVSSRVREPDAIGSDGPGAMPGGRRRVLVVDDNKDAADSFAYVLKLLGNDVRTAYDGEAGIEAAGVFRPDVVLLDIGMPKLNGYDACRRIRGEAWGRDIVLIAMTGWGQDEDKRRSLDAGFNAHLVKPVDTEILQTLMARTDLTAMRPPT